MLDIYFRATKDRIFQPLCSIIPNSITPTHITAAGFVVGLVSCICAANGHTKLGVFLWLSNRALDCLDGTLARHRAVSSDLGGFLDLGADFVIYSLVPIACALNSNNNSSSISNSNSNSNSNSISSSRNGGNNNEGLWLAVAFVEASFHINNFVLFYAAAVLEKRKAAATTTATAAAATAKAIAVSDNEETAKHSSSTTEINSTGSVRRDTTKELTSVMMRPALIEGMESGILFTIMLARPQWTQRLCATMALLVGIGIVQRVTWLASVM